MKNIITVVSILLGIHIVLSQEVTQKQFVNFNQTYEYDTFNRLQRIKDSTGKIVKEYTYHYQN